MVEEYKSKRLSAGLKNSSVNRELSCLRKIFNVAIDWGKASENPVRKVKFLSESSCIRERVLDEDEEDRLIKEATSFLKPILLVALQTGMRKSEVLNMMWQNIDFTTEEIRIVQSKSGKGRIIPMTSTLMSLLQTLKFQNGNSDYVFVNPGTGKPYVDITKAFSRACREAEVEDFHFHDLIRLQAGL